MTFSAPLAFLLLLPLGVVAWRLYRKGRHTGLLFSGVDRLPRVTAGWRAYAASVAPPLFLAGALLLIIAAARPRSVLSKERKSVNAIAIGMVVDVSESMKALDLAPAGRRKTRLDVVKEMFRRFVEKRPDDLISLVTFGGYASTRSPLTADHEALLHCLQGVEIPPRDGDGQELMTAIGDGLATGVARLTDAEPKTRILILLSDGESNTGIITPEQAADAAAKLAMRVYTIGVGSHNARTPFPVVDDFGRERIVYANTTFDETQLKAIAEKTGGRYFAVGDSDGLKASLDEIDSLEKTEIDRQVFHHYDEHFVPFLLWGAGLAVLALCLNIHFIRRML